MWKPIEKRHRIPNKSIESKSDHVNISRYEFLQELDNSLPQNDVHLCQTSKGYEQSILVGEETESVNNLIRSTQETEMTSSKEHFKVSSASRPIHRYIKRSSTLRGLNANFIHTIPLNSLVENNCDVAVTRWNATYGFEFLKFLGDMVDNGDAAIRVHVLFKSMQSLVGF